MEKVYDDELTLSETCAWLENQYGYKTTRTQVMQWVRNGSRGAKLRSEKRFRGRKLYLVTRPAWLVEFCERPLFKRLKPTAEAVA